MAEKKRLVAVTEETKKRAVEFLGKNATALVNVGSVLQKVSGFVPLFGSPVGAIGSFISYLGEVGQEDRETKQLAETLVEELRSVFDELTVLMDMFLKIDQKTMDPSDIDYLTKTPVYNEVLLLLQSIDTWSQLLVNKKLNDKKELEKVLDSLKRKHTRLTNMIQQATYVKVYQSLKLSEEILKNVKDLKVQSEKQHIEIKETMEDLKLIAKKNQEELLKRVEQVTGDKDDPVIIKKIVTDMAKDPLNDIYQAAECYSDQTYYALAGKLYEQCYERLPKLTKKEKEEFGRDEAKLIDKLYHCFENNMKKFPTRSMGPNIWRSKRTTATTPSK